MIEINIKDPSTIVKISISMEFWESQEKRKIVDHLRIADQAAKLKNKKNSSRFYLSATYDTPYTNTHGHEHPSFFVPPFFPTPKFSCGNVILKKTSQHQRERFPFPPPHFSDPILLFFHCPQQHFYLFFNKS